MISAPLAAAWQAFRRGRLLEAERLAAPFASGFGGNPQACLLLGVVHAKTGRISTAIQLLERALETSPRLFEAVNWLSFINFQIGEFETSEKYAIRALELNPGHSDALNNLGLSLYGLGRYEEAIDCYRKSIAANPGFAPTYQNLGSALLQIKENVEAEIVFNRGIALGGDCEPVRRFLAEIALATGDIARANSQARRAIEFNPGSAEAHLRLGTALVLAGNKEAITVFERALELRPENAEAYSSLGGALQAAGRTNEADVAFRRSLELQPMQGAAYYFLLNRYKGDEDLNEIVVGAERAMNTEALSDADRAMLCYSLGKTQENLGNYGRAMEYFDRARSIDHVIFQKGRPFPRELFQSWHEQIIDLFDARYIASIRRLKSSSFQPIFILGMMRSGTTLVDQIVSSHSEVKAAGEHGFFFRNRQLKPVAYNGELTPQLLEKEITSYLGKLDQSEGSERFITDKMPSNYYVVGLIHAAFPDAKIIHVRRNPVDTCLSIWTTANRTPPLFSFAKSDTVFAYRQYERIMEHWRNVLPSGSMGEIHYENLIDGHEATVRKIIEFCGLPWEDGCLHHETNPNPISTPSMWQARQPVFASSVSKWQKYLPYLGEFSLLLD